MAAGARSGIGTGGLVFSGPAGQAPARPVSAHGSPSSGGVQKTIVVGSHRDRQPGVRPDFLALQWLLAVRNTAAVDFKGDAFPCRGGFEFGKRSEDGAGLAPGWLAVLEKRRFLGCFCY